MRIEQHHFHPSILRAYDIRGVYGDTLTDADAWAVGRCFGAVIKREGGDTVAVGKDGRLSSDSLEQALVRGLIESGVQVICVGLCPTPLLYYAVKTLSVDGGIMITGSHNDKEFNGFKMTLPHRPFYGEDIQKFSQMVKQLPPTSSTGCVTRQDVSDSYIHRVLEDYRGKPLKVVWDIGNGAVGAVIKSFVKHLKGEHILLFDTVDGCFPNHHPDPTKEKNLFTLKEIVLKERADIGIAFDGDGDRIGVIDDGGNFWLGDFLMILYSRDVLENLPGSTIIMDIKSSDILLDDVKKHGGNPMMLPTGHSIIKAQMAVSHAPLAGETSGHIFFADHYYGFDDALYAAVRLLNIVSNLPCGLSGVYTSLPKIYNTPEIRISCDAARKESIIIEVKHRLLQDKNIDVITLDGVRVKTKEGWWLLRASNTEEVLVCRCESFSMQGLKELKNMVQDQLRLSKMNVILD